MNNISMNKCDLLFDFYEPAPSNGYLANGINETIAWFDMFYRPAPEIGGFSIMAGVQQLTEYIARLSFSEEDLESGGILRCGDGVSLEELEYGIDVVDLIVKKVEEM